MTNAQIQALVEALDVDSPDKVSVCLQGIATALQTASAKYGQAHGELSHAWQDDTAGRIWNKLSRVMECAATDIDRRVLQAHRAVSKEFRGK